MSARNRKVEPVSASSMPHGGKLMIDAERVAEGALQVCIRPDRDYFWEFRGTRAQLEAENVIPPGATWPEAAKSLSFEVGRCRYWLCRIRPSGAKCLKREWAANGDWWSLRCYLTSGPDLVTRRIAVKRRELAEEIYRQSPTGRREWCEQSIRYGNAHGDKSFQAFKAKLFPQRKKPVLQPLADAAQSDQERKTVKHRLVSNAKRE